MTTDRSIQRQAKALDQCPSTEKKVSATELAVRDAEPQRQISRATGRSLWRSLDDLAQTKEFKDFLWREFPAHASELLDGSRRHFLRIMGASLALAGVGSLTGCRRPEHRILPFNDAPEHSTPGKPLFYATAMPRPGGGAEGLLAETFEGRPTKLEGNPLHPINQGRSGLWSQASILELYDPDRNSAIYHAAEDSDDAPPTWERFTSGARRRFRRFNQSQGAGLSFLVDKTSSPTRDRLRDQLLERWPQAKWYAYEPVDNESALAGMRIAFGSPLRQSVDLTRARVVASFDNDFLGGESSSLEQVRQFASGRLTPGAEPGHEASGSDMNRLYVIESTMTLTGGQADHRWAVKPSRIGAVLVQLSERIMSRLGGADQPQLQRAITEASAGVGGDDLPDGEHLDALAADLVENAGAGAIMVGPSQPAEVHALAAALNGLLQNIGSVVTYRTLGSDQAQSSLESIRSLTSEMRSGAVSTLVIIGCNPVYDAPADLDFAGALAGIESSIHLGSSSETAEACTDRFLRSHYLETWSDVTADDGTYSVIQPQIAPLHASKSDLELLATILGERVTDPYEIVRETVRQRTTRDAVAFEQTWRRTLHDGSMRGTAQPGQPAVLRLRDITRSVQRLSSLCAPSTTVEVLFAPCPKVHDGRFANNGWLQESPQSVTKVSWDNPALISQATAERLGVSTNRHRVGPQYNHAQVATIGVGGRTVDAPMWLQPGLADDVIVVFLGYGRTRCGRIGEGVGFNAYSIRSSGAMRIARDASVEVTPGAPAQLIACTQDHWTMEGRQDSIFVEVDLAAWRKHGDSDFSHDDDVQVDPYGRRRGLNFAGRLTMESHTPSNKDLYLPTQRRMYGKQFVELDANGEPLVDGRGRLVGKLNDYGRRIQQWGMTIDLNTCTGCGACTVACQAENNIPIVGKTEVANGREMHWIRVDRYYASGPGAADHGRNGPTGSTIDMVTMPIPCMQCENAPCEVVCPVNATVHGPEGLNHMAYNRCIGTRYCSNNCPYKVRRFNYFDFGTKEFKGTNELTGTLLEPANENLVPPRLRQKKLEIASMQYNPHVTVRSRGVMEKCTYCIQRINAARVESKLEDLKIVPDGLVQTACQQACPSGSIAFGDIFDNESNGGAGSAVSQLRNGARSYSVLGYLNNGPRTTFLLRLRNPNPRIRPQNDEPFHHGGHAPHPGENGHDDSSEQTGEHADAGGAILSLPVLGAEGVRA